MIDISQWLIGLGVTGFEEPTANNQYEFFKGVQWTDGSVTNNQYEFFKKVGESRYDHFKQFGNERQFYKDIAVPVIKDYYTFYKYARDYITFYDYLLDNYGGAAAAYSLRKLNSTYTGDCIEVRRDSDNTVLNIGFVNNELDTTTLSTFCAGANGYVTKWYDQSGNGNDATQSTAANQPKIYDSASGIIEIDGKPAIDFEALPSYFDTSAVNYETAFTVAKIGVLNILNYINWSGSVGIGYGGIRTGADGLFFWYGSDTQSITGEDLNRHLGYFNDTGTQTQIAKDGEVETSFTKINDFAFNSISRDISVVSFRGKMQELIFYSSTQSSNRTGIEENINSRYQIYWNGATPRLLDTYSGAAAAYSLEAINAGYTGAIIQVRRDSDNTVLNIGAKYDGSLDVDKLNNFCNGANGFVTIWYDQSNSNNNLTQSTASAQPKIYDSVNGVIKVNGKPAIYTDGIDDELTSDILSLSNPNTQFFVIKSLVNSTTEYVGGLSFFAGMLLGANSDNLYFYQGGSTFTPTIPNGRNQMLFTAKTSTTGTNWEAYYNSNTLTNSGQNIGTNTGNKIFLGSRDNVSFGENYFQEYILYNSDETGNRVGIETNINQRYNIYQ